MYVCMYVCIYGENLFTLLLVKQKLLFNLKKICLKWQYTEKMSVFCTWER